MEFFRERGFIEFSLDKRGKVLTNTQWIILGIVIFLLIVFIIAVNYQSYNKEISDNKWSLKSFGTTSTTGEICKDDKDNPIYDGTQLCIYSYNTFGHVLNENICEMWCVYSLYSEIINEKACPDGCVSQEP